MEKWDGCCGSKYFWNECQMTRLRQSRESHSVWKKQQKHLESAKDA